MQIPMMTEADLVNGIKAVIPDAEVFLRDMTGDANHFDAVVVSDTFKGMSRVAQHQLVMGALKNYLSSGVLHALALKTFHKAAWQELEGI